MIRSFVPATLVLALLAYTARGFEVNWSTNDGGGGTSTGGGFTLSGTAGQPDAGAVLTGGDYALTGGFWAFAAPPEGCPGDYDCSGAIDFFDIDLLLAALSGEASWVATYQDLYGAAPPCDYLTNADTNNDGVVDFFDIDDFLSLLGTNCP